MVEKEIWGEQYRGRWSERERLYWKHGDDEKEKESEAETTHQEKRILRRVLVPALVLYQAIREGCSIRRLVEGEELLFGLCGLWMSTWVDTSVSWTVQETRLHSSLTKMKTIMSVFRDECIISTFLVYLDASSSNLNARNRVFLQVLQTLQPIWGSPVTTSIRFS